MDRMFDSNSQDSHLCTVDISDGAVDLRQLHEHVLTRNARVQLITRTHTQSCILISKEELDGLEKALEILSGTDDVRDMRDHLARIAAQAAEPSAAAGAHLR
jgi:PHD/YefM family antitoxin component YafN of YafNO toxin-antitoxin module